MYPVHAGIDFEVLVPNLTLSDTFCKQFVAQQNQPAGIG